MLACACVCVCSKDIDANLQQLGVKSVDLMLMHFQRGAGMMFARTVFPASFSLAEILVLAGTPGAGRMAPPTSNRISARLKRVQALHP